MELKVKRLFPDSVLPVRANETDAGLDLIANSRSLENKFIEYGTGIAVQIPEGFVGLLFPRSSVTNKTLMLKNSVGVIDSGYRGEIKARFQLARDFQESEVYEVGDKIAQLLIVPIMLLPVVEVDSLEDSERGEGGFGSSGQ